MATYRINIKLQLAENQAYQLLETCMQQENFIPVNTIEDDEKTFFYYGNQDLLFINATVKRAAMLTGKDFSYTVIKDRRTEKQYHTKEKSDQSLTSKV